MAEWRKKKGKKTNWGDWYRSDEEFEAMRWCLKNGIKIGLLAASPGEGPKHFYVEIQIGKKKSTDPSKYLAEDARKQVYKYYLYYYEKHRDPIPGASKGTTKGTFQI